MAYNVTSTLLSIEDASVKLLDTYPNGLWLASAPMQQSSHTPGARELIIF
jgi:hypothetical protein